MSESILTSVKKVLGLAEDYTAFDADVLMHINTTFGVLHQLGIGPTDGLIVVDATSTWEDFIGLLEETPGQLAFMNTVKTYTYLKVRMYFDPPQTSFLISAMDKQIQELEWRLSAFRETLVWTAAHPVDLEVVIIDGGTI